MVTIGTCSECKFGTIFSGRNVYCAHSSMRTSMEPEIFVPHDGVISVKNLSAHVGLMVGPNFGCIHWEKRKNIKKVV